MGKLKRTANMYFIDVTGGSGTPDYQLVGVQTDEGTLNYNPVTEEAQDITEDTSRVDITGYQVNVSLESKLVAKEGQKGYKVSNYFNGLRKSIAVLDELETKVLLVDAYSSTGAVDISGGSTGKFTADAQLWTATVQIDSYGGAAGESLSIGVTLNLNSKISDGSVQVTVDPNTKDKTAEYTPTT